MASRLSDYMKKEQLLKQLQQELLELESSDEMKTELQFKEKLEALMKKYEISSNQVITMLAPDSVKSSGSVKQSRKKRKLKVYQNPLTEEIIEARGANHKGLRAWRDEHGAEEVESWVIEEKD